MNRAATNAQDAKTRTREFWDANPCGLSATWDTAREVRFAYTDPYLRKYLNPAHFADRSVLEVGCGQGLDASEIVSLCKHYTGLDLSPASVEVATRENQRLHQGATNMTFTQGDAEHLSFDSEQFDCVYSVGVLHHTPDIDAALREAHRVLRPDGTLMLMLYRSYTPLWIVLKICRGVLRLPVLGNAIRNRVLRSGRSTQTTERTSLAGTVFMELVGCPIIRTYTLRGIRRRLRGRFVLRESACYRVGFDQVVRCVPRPMRFSWMVRAMRLLDQMMCRWLGFCLFMVFEKCSEPAARR